MSELHDELWTGAVGNKNITMEGLAEIYHDDFINALDEAMERQREACAEAWMKHAFDESTYGSRRKVSLTYAAILSARVEGT